MKRNLILILMLSIWGCSNKPSDYFIGKWQISSVIEDSVSIHLENNWIHLKNNYTFNSHDGVSDKNETGIWTYSDKHQKLFINSNAGEKKDSEWILSFKNDTLIFSSITGKTKLIGIRMTDYNLH